MHGVAAAAVVGGGGSGVLFPIHRRLPCFMTTLFLSSSPPMPHLPSTRAFASNSTSGLAQPLLTYAANSLSAAAELSKPVHTKPWLLTGLGNPGKKYHGTRHNVGFEMLNYIADAEGISMGSISFKAIFGKGFIGDVPVMLAKPQTFMNASGESVSAITSYYKIPLNQVLVILDDLDLPFSKLRLLPKGGHGGHNGMRSIINRFKGCQDFPRLKIGIGRPPGKMDPINFVIRPFNKQESRELEFTFQTGLEAVRILLLQGLDKSATFVSSDKSRNQLG